jgi:hypothetical protein
MNNMKLVAILAIFAASLATVGFTFKGSLPFNVQNNTTENIGLVTINGANGPVGQVNVPGPGIFPTNISAPAIGVVINNVFIPNGAIIKVPLQSGKIVTVDNTNSSPIIDANENN